MIVRSFFTATAYRSEAFSGSLSHTNNFPTAASHILLYTWQPRIQFLLKNSSMAVIFSMRFFPCFIATLLQMLCCKIFTLKYFRRTSTLRNFFNTKIVPPKILYNEIFSIYGMWQSWVDFCCVVLCSNCCGTELPLRVELMNAPICTSINHDNYICYKL